MVWFVGGSALISSYSCWSMTTKQNEMPLLSLHPQTLCVSITGVCVCSYAHVHMSACMYASIYIYI